MGQMPPENGATRKIIAQLKKDKVWIGRWPWEEYGLYRKKLAELLNIALVKQYQKH